MEVNELISTSLGAGYSDADVKVDAGNDAESYDLNFRMNFNFPWAYVSVGDGLTWNDYKKEDTSVNSNVLRSDVANAFDIILVKAVGELIPLLDPKNEISIFKIGTGLYLNNHVSCNCMPILEMLIS